MIRTVTLGVLATALAGMTLVAAPGAAQARSGEKWWTPRQGRDRHVEQRVIRNAGPRRFVRQWRNWGGNRVYRDVIVIRASRGPRYRAWRTYCPPEFLYSRRVIRVRPVRFVVAASGVIGGVRFHGSYHDDDCLYGCNFCDARFNSYDAYHAHVQSCGARPHGYRVESSDWNSPCGPDDDAWRDDDGRNGHDEGWDRDRGYDRDDHGDRGRWDDEIDDDYDR